MTRRSNLAIIMEIASPFGFDMPQRRFDFAANEQRLRSAR